MTDNSHKLQHASELLDQGRFAQARDTLQRVLRTSPADGAANSLMRRAMVGLGQPRQAVYYAERALAQSPGDPDLTAMLASTLADCGEHDKAQGLLEACVAAHPASIAPRLTLAYLYFARQRLGDCLRACTPAFEAGVRERRLFAVYAAALTRIGRADEAVPIMKHLISPAAGGPAPGPGDISNLCGAMLYDPTSEPSELLAAHLAFGRILSQAAPIQAPDWSRADKSGRWFDPDRPLRIGFVLPVVAGHPVQGFLEPLLDRLDRGTISTYLYATGEVRDEFSAACRTLVPQWRDVRDLGAPALAERCRSDRLDVAIDVSGHAASAAGLIAFHFHCAPVQAHWWTYPFTTGLPAISHRLTDSLVDPSADAGPASERLVRIDPCGAAYRPPAVGIEIDPEPPSARDASGGRVTFVSFAGAECINGAVIRAWARILKESRNARLILRSITLKHPDTVQHITQRFTAAGASAEMIVVEPASAAAADNLRAYNQADVALGTFPVCPARATCDALWMGVPVVAMDSTRPFARTARSVIHAAGLDDLVAANEDDYVTRAVNAAADVDRRRKLRSSLRQTLESSALRDEAGFARKFESAVRAMWRERCAAART